MLEKKAISTELEYRYSYNKLLQNLNLKLKPKAPIKIIIHGVRVRGNSNKEILYTYEKY